MRTLIFKQPSLLEDKHRYGYNNDETTFRSPTPGPDFSTVRTDSITLDDLIERITPTSNCTPEVTIVFSYENSCTSASSSSSSFCQITFLYPTLLCVRTHLNPTLLFNRIARTVFSNLAHISQVRKI